MRITGGRARGRVLKGRVASGVRPTSARVREAIFSMVGQDLSGQRVLDAFGGSGLLGLEAWSRGARVVTCERRGRTAATIRRHVQALGAEVDVVVGPVERRVGDLGRFTGLLADPPYALDPQPCLEALAPSIDRWMVFEVRASRPEPEVPEGWRLAVDRRFGDTRIWLLWRDATQEEGAVDGDG